MPKPPSRALSFAFVATFLSTGPMAGEARAAQDRSKENQVIERHHPSLAVLLDRIELAHRTLYERLAAASPAIDVPDSPGRDGGTDHETDHDAPPSSFDEETYQELADLIRVGRPSPNRSSTTGGVIPPRLEDIVRHTGTLHRRILSVYADPEVGDPRAAAEAAIDLYLSETELALPAEPKQMGLMHDHTYAMAFRRSYPRLAGLTWASHWLQLAAYDPFFLRATSDQRTKGMDTVIGRLASKLEDPPQGFPTQMPMAPTIAPSLLHWHPRAAGIFDNLNMMHEVIADLLVHPEALDREAEINRVIAEFMDPEYRVAAHSDWLRMALRHGIYNQGGPALGNLTRSERNLDHGDHDHGDHIILPGMGPP